MKWIWLFSIPALAQPSAKEVMAKVAGVYAHMQSIHVVAERSDTFARRGQGATESAQFELTARGRDHYYVRIKGSGVDAFALSDGDNTWRALASKKQWSTIAAASVEDDDAASQSRDLHLLVAATLYGQYGSIARTAKDPTLEREEEIKAAGAKIPCYVIQAEAANASYELWVDRERFVVVQSKMRRESRGTLSETKIRMTALEINSPIPDSRFEFEPVRGWSQVDMLALPGEDRLLLTGQKAANFSLKTLDGDPVTLDNLRGKVVVLDFWATWCPPCRKELPEVDKLRAEFGERVEFLGVNDEDAGTVKSFLHRNHYELMVLMDSRRQVERQYGVSAIPTLLVIGKSGVIRQHFIGFRDPATLRKAIESALAGN